MSDSPGPAGDYVPITEDNKNADEIPFFIGYQNSTKLPDTKGKLSARIIQ